MILRGESHTPLGESTITLCGQSHTPLRENLTLLMRLCVWEKHSRIALEKTKLFCVVKAYYSLGEAP